MSHDTTRNGNFVQNRLCSTSTDSQTMQLSFACEELENCFGADGVSGTDAYIGQASQRWRA